MKSKRISLIVRITSITLAATLFSVASIGLFSYLLNRSNVVNLSAERALTISRDVASALDPEQFAKIAQSQEKNTYWNTFKTYLDEVFVRNQLHYLYVLDANYDSQVTYFAEGFSAANTEEEELDLGDTESIEYFADEMFATINSGQESVTAIYPSGDLGSMVSGFAPIVDKTGKVIGVVGADISVDHVLAASNQFALFVIVFIVILCALVSIIIFLYIRQAIGRPITQVTAAAERIAQGDIDISLNIRRRDEIGALVDSFTHMIESTKKQSQVFAALASGDLSVEIVPRCPQDVSNATIGKMTENLNEMFFNIRSSAEHVSAAAAQIKVGGQSLSDATTEQAAIVEQLSASITEVASKTKDNTEMALRAALLSHTIRDNAEKGNLRMAQMLESVEAIGQASNSIGKVIKVIDDIAFQTNILALNAAVEAARAGQHGKGFAVVAEEVRNLAAKSAEAAKDTGGLINNSIDKAQVGMRIANETAESFAEILSGIGESSQIVEIIAQSSESQLDAIEGIHASIDQVSTVVAQNAATSEESAASSVEMSNEATVLKQLVSQFTLKE